MKPIENMSITEMMEELRQRREKEANPEEDLTEKLETLELEVSVLRALLSRQIVGIMVGPKYIEPEA